MNTEIFHIAGMHCPSCARLVEEDAGHAAGVETASVDLAAKTLRLVYDETTFQFADLEAAVKKSGFTISRA